MDVCIPGSSPHVRGTRRPFAEHAIPKRFIPACAGNAGRCHLPSQPRAVHPRMHGERLMGPITEPPGLGSSPHARGTRRAFSRPRPHRPVHPRMRGERSAIATPSSVTAGSSPHARGTPAADDPMTALVRFIPACAGNAALPQSRATRRTVHPRMRGERFRKLTKYCA